MAPLEPAARAQRQLNGSFRVRRNGSSCVSTSITECRSLVGRDTSASREGCDCETVCARAGLREEVIGTTGGRDGETPVALTKLPGVKTAHVETDTTPSKKATAYTFEVLMAWMGGRARWRTMPWMVTFFFILVVPLGLTHIILVILQPVVVGEWCTLCLAAATLMMIMIPFTVDEVIAMGQFLRERVRAGKPFWWTFWVGDTMEGGGPDERTPRYGARLPALLPAARWGVTVLWSLAASATVGLWLMFAPAVLGSEGRAAASDNLVGALVVTVAVLSTAEVIRALRFLNLLFSVWLVIAPWVLVGASTAARWSDMAAGLAIVILPLPRGIVRDRYGPWDAYVV